MVWSMLPVHVFCSFPLQKDEFAIADYALVHTCKKMIRVSKYFCRVELIFLCPLIQTLTAAPQPSPLPHFSMPKFKFVVVCLFHLSEVCHMMFCQCICNVPVLFCRNIVTLRRRNLTFWIVWRRRKMMMTLTINVDALWYSARLHRPEVSCCWRAACSSRLCPKSSAQSAGPGGVSGRAAVGYSSRSEYSSGCFCCCQELCPISAFQVHWTGVFFSIPLRYSDVCHNTGNSELDLCMWYMINCFCLDDCGLMTCILYRYVCVCVWLWLNVQVPCALTRLGTIKNLLLLLWWLNLTCRVLAMAWPGFARCLALLFGCTSSLCLHACVMSSCLLPSV